MNFFKRGLRRAVKILGAHKLLHPKTIITLLHAIELSRFPDLKNPQDLNEKLIDLYFKSETSLWSQLTDKAAVREYIEKKGLKDILIPLAGIYSRADEIDFNSLPDSFVIKATDASARNIIVADKKLADFPKLKKIIDNWQKNKFGYATGEKHYLQIPPAIIIEEKLGGASEMLPIDYKFMCFNSEVHSCLVCSERDPKSFVSRRNLMNPYTWEEIPGSVNKFCHGNPLKAPKPQNLKKMVEIASKLSEGFPFVRVDLYEFQGNVYFGELTFTPSGCHISSITREVLLEMGKKL